MVEFASGAIMNPDGTITQVVDARATPPTPAPVTPPAAPVEPDAAGTAADGEPPPPAEPVEGTPAEGTDAEPVEDDGQHEPEDATQEFNESNRGFRQRILNENRDLRRQTREDRALVRYLQEQINELRQRPATAQDQQAQAPQGLPGLPPRPQQANYASYTEYEDALFTWYDQRRSAQAAAEQAAQAQRTAQQEWAQKEELGRDKFHDYDQVVQRTAFAPHVAPLVAAAVRESDHGPDLLYYLGKHPNDLQTLNTLSTYKAAQWLVQLESRVAPGSAASASTSRELPAGGRQAAPPAPRPIAPVGTGAAVPVGGVLQPDGTVRAGIGIREYEQQRLKERNGRT